MSSFLAAQSATVGPWIRSTDLRIAEMQIDGDNRRSDRPWEGGRLWSSSRVLGGEAFPHSDAQTSGEWSTEPDFEGARSWRKIIGLTLDAAGAPLGSVTVQAFLTATDAYVGETISDAGGYYQLPTNFPGQAHYLVMYKSGSPDLAGTSVNTLLPV